MNVVVKLFAGARELVGKDEIAVEIGSGATIGELREHIFRQHAELRPLLPHVMFAIETTYCNEDTPIPENAVVACIPPVSGG
ncbi:MAG: MoaD/ThiS family protein [Planctomycetes bacterium]|nr:MoaD/ThiS family protein [Planctomycetota bacterium]